MEMSQLASSPSKYLPKPGLGQAEARNQELHSGFPCEWQKHKPGVFHLLLSRVHIGRKLELEEELKF